AGLVLGGLGWVTAAALRLEQEQQELRNLRLALWRLDSRIAPILAQEDSRPYSHYSAIHAPSAAFSNNGMTFPPGSVLEPSPLLSADLPPWMLLHFQADEESGWASPQVLSSALSARLDNKQAKVALKNVTPERARILRELSGQLSTQRVLAELRQ